jgi:hypothetical protein
MFKDKFTKKIIKQHTEVTFISVGVIFCTFNKNKTLRHVIISLYLYVWIILQNLIQYFYFQIRTIAIIAEGIPENLTRQLIKTADEKGVAIIGPATVSVV